MEGQLQSYTTTSAIWSDSFSLFSFADLRTGTSAGMSPACNMGFRITCDAERVHYNMSMGVWSRVTSSHQELIESAMSS